VAAGVSAPAVAVAKEVMVPRKKALADWKMPRSGVDTLRTSPGLAGSTTSSAFARSGASASFGATAAAGAGATGAASGGTVGASAGTASAGPETAAQAKAGRDSLSRGKNLDKLLEDLDSLYASHATPEGAGAAGTPGTTTVASVAGPSTGDGSADRAPSTSAATPPSSGTEGNRSAAGLTTTAVASVSPSAAATTQDVEKAANPSKTAGVSVASVNEQLSVEPTDLDLAALEPVPVGKAPQELFLVQGGAVVNFPVVYQQVKKLMPGACPDRVRVVRVPYGPGRAEGSAWVDPDGQFLFFRTDEPDFYRAPGFDSQLFSMLGKACLANISRQGATSLSREEKGLRFLEEGFGLYLYTRPEQSAVGGRPEGSRNFADFVATIELMNGFQFDTFWDRLPSRKESLDPNVTLHARRLEATYVAGAFVRDLIEEQGMGVKGFMDLFKALAANPFRNDGSGHLIPQVAVKPVLSSFMTVATGGKISSLDKAWSAFVSRVGQKTYDRPTVDLWMEGSTLVIAFSRPMIADRVDVTLDDVQIGPERLSAGLGTWVDDRTVHLDLKEACSQMGFDKVSLVQVNWGRIWQWFRARDGIPAEGGMLSVPRDVFKTAAGGRR